MSLLDDVSIVVTPNGYKAGELYAVIPVPTEGAEAVTNGDFATTSWWSVGTYWAITGNGLATRTVVGSQTNYSVSRASALTVGMFYKVVLIIDSITSGNVKIVLGATNGDEYTEAGTYIFTGVCSTNQTLKISPSDDFNGSISNVSVKEYTSADMDVTRATAATRVDENGLVNYAEVLGGEEVDNGDFSNGTTGWSEENSSTISVGTHQGRTNVADINIGDTSSGSRIQQLFDYVNGKTYQISVDVYLVSGSFRSDSRDAFVSDDFVSTSTTGSWITLTSTFTAIQTGQDVVWLRSLSEVSQFYVDSISIKEVQRDNVPRIDYTGGGCPHILAEPMRTNLITYSEDFSQSYWTKTGITLESGNTSPDGTVNAYKLVEDTSTGQHRTFSGIQTVSSGVTVTSSIYVKSAERSWFLLEESQSGAGYYFNNGVVGSNVGSPLNYKIDTLLNGWFRYSITTTAAATTTRLMFRISESDGVISYTGDGTSGLYAWGGQIEQGSYATSYIPTSGSTVTRNQDIFTRDGIGSLIGQTEGTFFIELSKPVLNPDSYYLISLNNAAADTNANSVTIGFDSSSADFYIRLESGGSTIYVDNNRASLANTFYKIAVAYKSGQSLIYIDGSPITPNSGSLSGAFSFSETLDNLSFDYDGNNSLAFFGKVKQLQVFKTALTDSELIALTT